MPPATHLRTLRLTGCEIDLARAVVVRGATETALTPLETGLLAYLARHADRAVPNDELLVEVWGYRPDVKSRAVAFTVKRLRAKIELDPRAPVHLLTARGVGVRLVLPAAETPAGFFGRRDELAELERLATSGTTPVAVLGPGGIGKTTLVQEHVRQTLAPVPVCDLTTATDRADVLQAMAVALELTPGSDADALDDRIAAALSDRTGLVVVDNAEAVADVLGDQLPRWTGPRLLLTSRVPIPGTHPLPLRRLAAGEALALFVHRAGRHRAGWVPDEPERRDVGALVERLGGLPLAIELAAARSGVLSTAELRSRLEASLSLLDGAVTDHPPRQASLEATIRWSWELLSPQAQRALAWLAVFAGDTSVDAAEAVLRSLGPGDVAPIDLLALLKDHALVRESEPGRIGLHLGVHAVASSALDASGERDAAENAHRDHYLDWAAALDATHDPGAGQQALTREIGQLLVIQDRFGETDPHSAARALSLAAPVLDHALPVKVQATRLRRCRDRLGDRTPARIVTGLGWAETLLGRVDDGVALLREARTLAVEQGDRLAEARASASLGTWVQTTAGPIAAEPLFEQSVALWRAAGSPWQVSLGLNGLAICCAAQGRLDEAEDLLHEARELLATAGQPAVSVLNTLANVYLRAGRTGEAEATYVQALDLARATHDRHREGVLLGNLGAVLLSRDALAEAAETFQAAAALHRWSGRRSGLALALGNLGRVRHLRHELAAALEPLDASVGLLEALGDPKRASWFRMFQAALLVDRGLAGGAQRAQDAAVRHATAAGEALDPALLAMVGAHRALHALEEGSGPVEAAERAVADLEALDHPELGPRTRALGRRLRARRGP